MADLLSTFEVEAVALPKRESADEGTARQILETSFNNNVAVSLPYTDDKTAKKIVSLLSKVGRSMEPQRMRVESEVKVAADGTQRLWVQAKKGRAKRGSKQEENGAAETATKKAAK